LSYIIDGKLLICPQTTTSNRYGTIAVFNESTKSLETIFTALVSSSSSSYSYCTIYEFNGKYYVSADGSNFALMTKNKDGEFEFKTINLKCNLTSTKYKLDDDKYLFVDNGIKYYDFATDTYKVLLSGNSSNSYSIKDLSVDGDIVTIYVDNNVKYEFNLKSLTFKAVAYWQ
jgi:hypothetical protein